MDKRRATLGQLTRAYKLLNDNIGMHARAFREAIDDLYRNQEELKNGLVAAEFNLRAHQKALNATALEIERIRNFSLALIPEGMVKDELQEDILQMAEVALPTEDEDEEPAIVRRVDWPYYHAQVEKDLKILEALETARREAEEAEKIAEAASSETKEAQEEPPQDDGIPEDAVVFGGNV